MEKRVPEGIRFPKKLPQRSGSKLPLRKGPYKTKVWPA